MWWHEYVSPRFRGLDKNIPVVIPLGSCEQHGPHLPVFVDTIQVSAIVDRLEERLGDRAIFVPPLWLGSSHHHLDFPGTISVRPSLYSRMIQEIATSILGAGFERLFFLNGHGGNQTPVSQALTELVALDDRADAAQLAMASWWQVARERLSSKEHEMGTPALSHACEYETSLMLFLRPELVDQASAVDVPPALDSEWVDQSVKGGRVTVFHRFHRLTATGNMGQPTVATAAKGRSILQAVVDEIARFLDDFATWPMASTDGDVATR